MRVLIYLDAFITVWHMHPVHSSWCIFPNCGNLIIFSNRLMYIYLEYVCVLVNELQNNWTPTTTKLNSWIVLVELQHLISTWPGCISLFTVHNVSCVLAGVCFHWKLTNCKRLKVFYSVHRQSSRQLEQCYQSLRTLMQPLAHTHAHVIVLSVLKNRPST